MAVFTFKYPLSAHVREQFQGGKLPFASVSEGSVHGDLAAGTWTEHHDGGNMVGRFFTLWCTGSREQGKG